MVESSEVGRSSAVEGEHAEVVERSSAEAEEEIVEALEHAEGEGDCSEEQTAEAEGGNVGQAVAVAHSLAEPEPARQRWARGCDRLAGVS